MARLFAIGGKPSCSNGDILNEIVREQWNFTDALITSDCGAIINLRGQFSLEES